ncbi:11591_t:CDS:2 [Gigaspora margarita]|uniref:11591_t:CDS:1 n=1 Tax=Gigaspora margarita TaxID=4874 RepID=A0ABN7UUI5_GIGMA|nr:11591_t:CDS:2 [Gigaspora margarita]
MQDTVLQVHLKAEKKIFEHSTSDKNYNVKKLQAKKTKGCSSQISKDWFIRVNKD